MPVSFASAEPIADAVFERNKRTSQRSKGEGHDPEADVGQVPALLAEEEPADRTPPQPRYLHQPRRRRETRTRGAVFQTALTAAGVIGALHRSRKPTAVTPITKACRTCALIRSPFRRTVPVVS